MNASTLTPPEPGTLNDRILCAIVRAGDTATRVAISQAVECNDSVLQIAINALQRSGHLTCSDAGVYALHPALLPSYEFLRTLPAAQEGHTAQHVPRLITPRSLRPAAVASPVVASQPDGDRNVKTQQCTGKYSCGKEKPLSEFYAGQANCKRCVLDRQKELKAARQNGTDATAKATPVNLAKTQDEPSPKKPAAAASMLVVPASGAIACELQGHGVTLRQGDAVVSIDFRQLDQVSDWINSIRKAKAAA